MHCELLGLLEAIARHEGELVALSERARIERGFDDEAKELLKQIGLLRINVPKEFGGTSLELRETLQVLSQLARLDASLAWIVMISLEGPILLSLFGGSVFKEIFQYSPDVYLASSSIPAGWALEDGEKLRVSGKWPFASGCLQADIYMGHTLVTRDHGKKERCGILFRREDVRIEKSWEVAGLLGTGSHRVAVDDLMVSKRYSFVAYSSEPCVYKGVFRIPIRPHFATHMAAISIGNAYRALDSLEQSLKSVFKGTSSNKRSRESDITPDLVGRSKASLSLMERGLSKLSEELQHDADSCSGVSESESLFVRSQCAFIAEECTRVCQSLFRLSGSRVIFHNNVNNIVLGDALTIGQHANLSPGLFADLGAEVLTHTAPTITQDANA